MRTWPLLPKIASSPHLFLLADPALPDATPACGIAIQAATEVRFSYATVPGSSHLLEVEKPEQCIAAIRQFFAKAGFG